jgi:hypothetical protein
MEQINMDSLDGILQHLVCLPGAIGLEGVNPTCVEWGFQPQGYLPMLAALPWIGGIAGILFGVPMAAWFASILMDRLGVNLGRR